MKTYPNLNWPEMVRLSDIFQLPLEKAQELLVYIIDNDVIPKHPYETSYEEALSDEYKQGWNDACEYIAESFDTWQYKYTIDRDKR